MRLDSRFSRAVGPAIGLLALYLTGCDATQQLQAVSAGQTGCAPQEIRITDDDPGFGSRSWVAWCKGERFQCSGTRDSISCKAAQSAEPEVASEVAPTPRVEHSWVNHELEGCGVAAEFPSAPVDEQQMLSTSQGPVELKLAHAALANGRGEATLACSAVPKKKRTDVVMLDGARDGMLKSIGATLTREREIIGGREVVFERDGEQGLAHLLLINDEIVVATVVPVSAFEQSAAKRFVNSVELAETPSRANQLRAGRSALCGPVTRVIRRQPGHRLRLSQTTVTTLRLSLIHI